MTPSEPPEEEEERFRDALRALRGRGPSTDLAIASLVAAVQGDARYELIARGELSPRAGEMDLHLTGNLRLWATLPTPLRSANS